MSDYKAKYNYTQSPKVPHIEDIRYDYTSINTKKEKMNEIINYYEAFMWEKDLVEDDPWYDDYINIRLKRIKTLKNKDTLILLQMNLENKLEEDKNLDVSKHTKTKTYSITLGIILLGILIGSIIEIIFFYSLLNLIIGLIIILLVFFASLITILKLRKLFFQERIDYNENKAKIKNELNELIEIVSETIKA